MHYYLWALPFVFLWCLESVEKGTRNHWVPALAVLATLIALIGQYCFPYSYTQLIYQVGWLPILANLVRNLLVLSITIACLWASQERRSARS